MDAVCEIIRDTNVYLAKVGSPSGPPHPQPLLLRKAAATVTRFLSAVGLVDGPGDQLGFSDAAGGGAAAAAGTDAQGARYLDAFAAFRDEVRSMAKAKAEPAAMLAACDRLRDVTLADLGVRLEDRPDGRAVWKLDDPAALRVEQEERARAAAEAAARKVAAALEKKSKDLEKLRGLAALPTAQAALSDKYSQFDEATGEPTHDKDGAALEGKAKDKARKDWEKQVKVREPLAKRLAEDGPEALDKLAAEVQELTRQLAALGTTASTAPAAAVTNGTK